MRDPHEQLHRVEGDARRRNAERRAAAEKQSAHIRCSQCGRSEIDGQQTNPEVRPAGIRVRGAVITGWRHRRDDSLSPSVSWLE